MNGLKEDIEEEGSAKVSILRKKEARIIITFVAQEAGCLNVSSWMEITF